MRFYEIHNFPSVRGGNDSFIFAYDFDYRTVVRYDDKTAEKERKGNKGND